MYQLFYVPWAMLYNDTKCVRYETREYMFYVAHCRSVLGVQAVKPRKEHQPWLILLYGSIFSREPASNMNKVVGIAHMQP